MVGYGKDEQGRTVALARKRSSYGKDTLDQLFFQDLTYKNRIRSFADFARSASQTPQTFNSFYADTSTTGVYTTGLLPLRPRGVDPGLPVDGRGGYEWKGYLADSQAPAGHGLERPAGQLEQQAGAQLRRRRRPLRQREHVPARATCCWPSSGAASATRSPR